MENIVLHYKIVKGLRGVLLAYVFQRHVKVVNISPGYGAYLNLDMDIIVRAPTVDEMSNFKLNWNSLDRVYIDYQ